MVAAITLEKIKKGLWIDIMTWLDKVTKFWCTIEEGRVVQVTTMSIQFRKLAKRIVSTYILTKIKLEEIYLKH